MAIMESKPVSDVRILAKMRHIFSDITCETKIERVPEHEPYIFVPDVQEVTLFASDHTRPITAPGMVAIQIKEYGQQGKRFHYEVRCGYDAPRNRLLVGRAYRHQWNRRPIG